MNIEFQVEGRLFTRNTISIITVLINMKLLKLYILQWVSKVFSDFRLKTTFCATIYPFWMPCFVFQHDFKQILNHDRLHNCRFLSTDGAAKCCNWWNDVCYKKNIIISECVSWQLNKRMTVSCQCVKFLLFSFASTNKVQV